MEREGRLGSWHARTEKRDFLDGEMNFCGRQRFWVADGGRIGGRMNSCGRYVGD